MKILMRFILVLCCILTMMAFASGCSEEIAEPVGDEQDQKETVESVTWVSQQGQHGDYYGTPSLMFDRWLNNISGGLIKVDQNPPNSLMHPFDIFSAVSDGTLDMGSYLHYSLALGNIEEAVLEELPIITQDRLLHWDFIWNSGFYEKQSELYKEHNIKWFPLIGGIKYGFGTAEEITELADLDGKIIRVGSGVLEDLVKTFGGSTTVFPNEETYMNLETGVVDGAAGGVAYLKESSWSEVMSTFYYDPPLTLIAGAMLINLDRWNELPSHTQDLVENNLKYWNLETLVHVNKYEQQVVNELKRSKEVNFLELSDEELDKMNKVSLSFMDKLAERGDYYKEVINMAKDHLEEWNYNIEY